MDGWMGGGREERERFATCCIVQSWAGSSSSSLEREMGVEVEERRKKEGKEEKREGREDGWNVPFLFKLVRQLCTPDFDLPLLLVVEDALVGLTVFREVVHGSEVCAGSESSRRTFTRSESRKVFHDWRKEKEKEVSVRKRGGGEEEEREGKGERTISVCSTERERREEEGGRMSA